MSLRIVYEERTVLNVGDEPTRLPPLRLEPSGVVVVRAFRTSSRVVTPTSPVVKSRIEQKLRDVYRRPFTELPAWRLDRAYPSVSAPVAFGPPPGPPDAEFRAGDGYR